MAATTDNEIPRQSLAGGQLLVAISGAVVRLFRECTGKGPEHCKAHWAVENTVLVLLGGGFTGAERTLFEAGHTITDADGASAPVELTPADEAHEVVLHEEQLVIEKRVVATERARIGKRTTTATQSITDEVRKERIDV